MEQADSMQQFRKVHLIDFVSDRKIIVMSIPDDTLEESHSLRQEAYA